MSPPLSAMKNVCTCARILQGNWLHSIPVVVETGVFQVYLASEQPAISHLLFDLTSITEPIR